MTKKILAILMTLILCLTCLGACQDSSINSNTDNSTNNDNNTSTAYDNMLANMSADSEVDNIAYTYVGSYVTINTMGVVRAAHIVNLYDDNSVEIYMGFFNDGMGGSLQEQYTGTYSIVGTTLTIDYVSYGNNEDNRQLVAEVTEGQFEGKLWMGASLPTYDVVYYSVDATSVANSNEVYIGTTTDDNSYVANILALYHGAEGSYPEDEGMLVLVTAANSINSSITGNYTKLWADLDNDDMLQFSYELVTDTVNYSNYYVLTTSFTVEGSIYDNTLVRVK